MKPRLMDIYRTEIKKKLIEKFKYSNEMEVPRLSKVVVNMGLGEALENIKLLDSSVEEVSIITGQRPVITKARKSISNFKLREGMPIGTKVTLRGENMYFFIDKLFNIALPRVRDFKGVSPKGFDGRGNYTFGVREQIIFPEIDYDKIQKIKGMNITFVTTARNDEEAHEFLKLLGLPFRA
jgi:large subunit ribosomal protein L5